MTNKNENKKFKEWFDHDAARLLGEQLLSSYPQLDLEEFIHLATKNIDHLEMQDRVSQFSQAMAVCLPENKQPALKIITQSLPDILPGTDVITNGWLQWPVGKFIADYGISHYEAALDAMIELTQRFSSEFAVRPFVERMPEKIIPDLIRLCNHHSPHVRRWCSEGTRPLLPWGKKLHALVEDPSPVLPILEALKDDPEKYVQKSVGNHLNDISKNHPELVVATCKKWMKTAGPERKWIIARGLRTLMKEGHSGALELMGFPPAKNLRVELDVSPSQIPIGSSVELQVSLKNEYGQTQKLLIDYAVTYVRKQQNTGRKVFKGTTKTLQASEETTFTKKHPMKVTTTRALYPGEHLVEILVNGERITMESFTLKA